MAEIRAFAAFRPAAGMEDKIAALPYDVFNREEAKRVVRSNPLSFLAIDRAETQFPDTVSTYDDRVYQKARDMLDEAIENSSFVQDPAPCYYLYEQTMNGRSQTGIVACSSIDDYLSGVIKKHENTRVTKELDRIRHVDTCNAQTGPSPKAAYATASGSSVTRPIWRRSTALLQKWTGSISRTVITDVPQRSRSA